MMFNVRFTRLILYNSSDTVSHSASAGAHENKPQVRDLCENVPQACCSKSGERRQTVGFVTPALL